MLCFLGSCYLSPPLSPLSFILSSLMGLNLRWCNKMVCLIRLFKFMIIMIKKYFLIWVLIGCFSSVIAQNYVPVKIASGFNADVIANGVGSVTSSTTHTFDVSEALMRPIP